MDTAEWFVFIGGTLLIAFTLWFFFGKREEENAAMNAEGQPIYECPMHSWITSTDPAANCTLCGMKLVRRGDAGSQHEALQQGHDGMPNDTDGTGAEAHGIEAHGTKPNGPTHH